MITIRPAEISAKWILLMVLISGFACGWFGREAWIIYCAERSHEMEMEVLRAIAPPPSPPSTRCPRDMPNDFNIRVIPGA